MGVTDTIGTGVVLGTTEDSAPAEPQERDWPWLKGPHAFKVYSVHLQCGSTFFKSFGAYAAESEEAAIAQAKADWEPSDGEKREVEASERAHGAEAHWWAEHLRPEEDSDD